MTRGNQRDLARAKNLKKQKELAKAEGSKDYPKRKERDSDIMRQKQKLAEEKRLAEAGGGEQKSK